MVASLLNGGAGIVGPGGRAAPPGDRSPDVPRDTRPSAERRPQDGLGDACLSNAPLGSPYRPGFIPISVAGLSGVRKQGAGVAWPAQHHPADRRPGRLHGCDRSHYAPGWQGAAPDALTSGFRWGLLRVDGRGGTRDPAGSQPRRPTTSGRGEPAQRGACSGRGIATSATGRTGRLRSTRRQLAVSRPRTGLRDTRRQQLGCSMRRANRFRAILT